MSVKTGELLACCRQAGMSEAAPVPMETLVFHPDVRAVCEGDSCRNYGKSWACPPAVGTLEDCEKRCRSFGTFFLFSRRYELEDSWDFEGMREGHVDFQKRVDLLDERLKAAGIGDFLLLSNEGCLRCAKCTYPDAPCRFPEKLHPSLEGFGFVVSALAKAAGMQYRPGANALYYFGAILCRESEN